MLYLFGLFFIITCPLFASDVELTRDRDLSAFLLQTIPGAETAAIQNISYLYPDLYRLHYQTCMRIIDESIATSTIDLLGLLVDTDLMMQKIRRALTKIQSLQPRESIKESSVATALTKLKCSHVFHKQCLRQLLNAKLREKCPLCRKNFIKKDMRYIHPRHVHQVRKNSCAICLYPLRSSSRPKCNEQPT